MYKIVLCQACKFYHSWRQLWSYDTVVLLLVTCQKGKLLCLLWSFLLYWTFCLLWGHFHAENETETSSENNNRKFTYISYGLWLIMIDTKIFWFQMISTISWLIKCMLSIWRLNLFIKRHVSLKVNIYYSHMRRLILDGLNRVCEFVNIHDQMISIIDFIYIHKTIRQVSTDPITCGLNFL